MRIDLHFHHHIYHHGGGDDKRLAQLRGELKSMAHELSETLALVRDEKTVGDSLVVLTDAIKQKLDAIIGGKLTDEQQAQVDEIFDTITAQKQEAADAILRDTPNEQPANGGTGQPS